MSARVAVLKGGRSLERQVSLSSVARVEDALARLGHEVVPIDVGGDLVARLREARPDVAFAYDTRFLLERFDFEARYEIGRTEFLRPAPLDAATAARTLPQPADAGRHRFRRVRGTGPGARCKT